MSFLDTLTAAFTGRPNVQAAQQQRQYLQGVSNTGRSDITQGATSAANALQAGYGAASPILASQYDASRNYLLGGNNQALGYIDAGTSGAQNALSGARDAYGNLVTKYGGATSLQLDALGVNGAEGTARAQQAFKTGPGYQFNMDQGLEAVNRARAAGGMLASGNTSTDAMNYASGLASKEYGGWLDRLGNYINPELAATTGVANVGTQQANLLSQAGQSRANVAANTGGLLSSLASSYGNQAAGLQTGLGQNLANVYTNQAGQNVNLASNLAQPYSNTYQQEANAQTGGSANLWGLLSNLARSGTGAYSSYGRSNR